MNLGALNVAIALVLIVISWAIGWEKRIVISVEDGYRRKADVLIQTELATLNKVFVEDNATPNLHAQYIKRAIRSIE